jgi:hypothetical protein
MLMVAPEAARKRKTRSLPNLGTASTTACTHAGSMSP